MNTNNEIMELLLISVQFLDSDVLIYEQYSLSLNFEQAQIFQSSTSKTNTSF